MNDIITEAMAITTLTKILVDMTKMAVPDLPKWLGPVGALVYAIVIGQLMILASGVVLTPQGVSMSILSAILAAGAAVGVTELQKRVP